MHASIWETMVLLCDWRVWKRALYRENKLDVVFISNLRDDVDRQRFIGGSQPRFGHVSGARINLKGVHGSLRFIDVDTTEMLSASGRRKAKDKFIAAVRWAEARGAKVILLAAATKRLFGRDGDEIMQMFPHIVFTIGDNGTACLLIEEVFSALKTAKLDQKTARIAILGPYGILGQSVAQAMIKNGYQFIGVGSNVSKLEELMTTHGIEIATDLYELNNIDIVVACTHSKKTLLTSEIVSKIKRSDKKLIVIDVAEPSNLVAEEYQACKDIVIRQDAGNAHSKHLKYVMGSVSYNMLRLTEGVIFGCFAEAMSIAYCLKNGENIQRDWFEVSDHNIEFAKKMFEKTEFGVPQPRCFGEMVTSFER